MSANGDSKKRKLNEISIEGSASNKLAKTDDFEVRS